MAREPREPGAPHSYGRAHPWLLRRAYLAYVQGHDRGWETERKQQVAEAILETEARQRRRPEGADGPRSEPELDEAGGGERPVRRAAAVPRLGVPIPERLDFHRGPDIWRDRVGPGARR